MKQMLILLVAGMLFSTATMGQGVGSVAPDFTLNDLSNNAVKLSDYKGKVVMVFLFGYNCPFCISASSSIKSQILNEFSGNSNFVAIGIDTWNGSLSQVNNFKSQTGLTIPLLQKGGGVASSWNTTYDRLVVIDADGKFKYIGTSGAGSTVAQAKSAVIAALDLVTTPVSTVKSVVLKQNYPNPFSKSTSIPFVLTEASEVKITISDLSGKQVAEVVNGSYPSGQHEVLFTADGLNKGMYIYTIQTNKGNHSIRMVYR
jgi:peroxiredoxin